MAVRVSPRAQGWGAGVVERGGPENRYIRKGIEGSNPSPTALKILTFKKPCLIFLRKTENQKI